MKEYKKEKTSFFYKNKNSKCYFYKELYHGFYNYFFINNDNELKFFKGYYNMSKKYGHWFYGEYQSRYFL